MDPHAAVDRGRAGRDAALGTSHPPNGAAMAVDGGRRLGGPLLMLIALLVLAGVVLGGLNRPLAATLGGFAIGSGQAMKLQIAPAPSTDALTTQQ